MSMNVRLPPQAVRRALVVLVIATLAATTIPSVHVEAQNLPSTLYTLEGYVYDSNAKPLQGASISVRPSGGGAEKTATSGADGKYSITSLASGTYNVTAASSGLVSAFVPVRVQGADATIQQSFLLRKPDQEIYGPPMALKGVVKNESSGQPLANVLIELWNYYYPSKQDSSYAAPINNNQQYTTHSASDGSYGFTLSEGSVSLTASHPGFDRLHASFEIREDRTLDLPMRPSSQQSVELSGTVKAEDGAPVPDAYVSVQPDYSRCGAYGCPEPASSAESQPGQEGDVYFYYEPANSPYNSTQTDSSGKWRLKTTPGTILVTANAADYLQDQERVEARSGESKTVNLVLPKLPPDAVKVSGRVVDAETGKAIAYAQLNLENQEWGHYNYTQSAEDGSYEFWTKRGYTIVTATAYEYYYVPCMVASDSPAGDGIRPSEPCPGGDGKRDREYYPRAATFVGQDDEPQQLDFKLAPRPLPDAEFQGYVVNASSEKGVAGATVTFFNEFSRDYGQATTDEEGSYQIRVHGGYYTIRTYATGYFDAVVNAEIKSGDNHRLDLFVTPGEKRYGYCCIAYSEGAYATKGGAGYATGAPVAAQDSSRRSGPGPMTTSATPGDADADGRQAYVGSGGGLGPYSPAQQGPNAKASGAPLVAALVGALIGLALVRRRR